MPAWVCRWRPHWRLRHTGLKGECLWPPPLRRPGGKCSTPISSAPRRIVDGLAGAPFLACTGFVNPGLQSRPAVFGQLLVQKRVKPLAPIRRFTLQQHLLRLSRIQFAPVPELIAAEGTVVEGKSKKAKHPAQRVRTRAVDFIQCAALRQLAVVATRARRISVGRWRRAVDKSSTSRRNVCSGTRLLRVSGVPRLWGGAKFPAHFGDNPALKTLKRQIR